MGTSTEDAGPRSTTSSRRSTYWGRWVASWPTCGFQLTTARTQERCEQRASRRRYPVGREDA